MSAVERVQRKRSKGWRMPEFCIYVGRPTALGNPYRVVPVPQSDRGLDKLAAADEYTVCSRAVAVDMFEDLVATPAGRTFVIGARAWSGWSMACWCPLDAPCHADTLLRLANDCSAFPLLWRDDARRSGSVCIRGRRLDADVVASCADSWGMEETADEWELTLAEVQQAASWTEGHLKPSETG